MATAVATDNGALSIRPHGLDCWRVKGFDSEACASVAGTLRLHGDGTFSLTGHVNGERCRQFNIRPPAAQRCAWDAPESLVGAVRAAVAFHEAKC